MFPWLLNKLLDKLTKEQRHAILTEVVEDSFNTVGADDILQERNGEWFLQGKSMIPGERDALIAEAQSLVKSRLWEVLKRDAKYQANKRMYFKSQTTDDLIAGKLLIFLLDVLDTRLKSMSKGSGIFNK